MLVSASLKVGGRGVRREHVIMMGEIVASAYSQELERMR